jgi:hypothetical protein
MNLVIHSDASYLSETKARSRAGGFHYLSRHPSYDNGLINGPIDIISSIIPTVVSAASEAEYAAQFINKQTGEGIRNILSDLGYPQDTTEIIADNTTACGIVNRQTKIRRSKAIDMRYHWIRDRVDQGHFKVIWQPGGSNIADYFTKTHPAKHYTDMRHIFVDESLPDGWTVVKPSQGRRPSILPYSLQGCVKAKTYSQTIGR